ncbi:Hydroxyethylthiazole kinase [Caloramator mitchellensis]|uniref:Hydroxyethylthiazole kinase n=1 Tax=Caloramator mitchellensis TaxID=908809 RepID=A0A0R3JVP3_CALMK|nr:hydroxyethylthiazole kinase [Caloramator mitchellensis]KRQ87632.1 Hydroxyethylthiazole kinase [Caloramator mitchellensis]
MEMLKKACDGLSKIREKSPLVHHITNYVSVNDCANITLAIGASPVMSDEIEDILDLIKIANSLVLNIGTLNKRTVESMIYLGKEANKLNIPVVLDPVGAGATKLRTGTSLKILQEVKVRVLRGNMSEIKSLLGLSGNTKGVDSTEKMDDAEDVAILAAKKFNCTVGISGEVDVISDGERVVKVFNGNSILTRVTGTGCMVTSLTGCFLGAGCDGLTSSTAAYLIMGLAGERAYKESGDNIGTFKVRLFDEIFNINEDRLKEGGKVEEC